VGNFKKMTHRQALKAPGPETIYNIALSQLGIQRVKFDEISKIIIQICDYVEDQELSPENMPPSLAAGVIGFVLNKKAYTDISHEKIATESVV
jgi:hypothetical protein